MEMEPPPLPASPKQRTNDSLQGWRNKIQEEEEEEDGEAEEKEEVEDGKEKEEEE